MTVELFGCPDFYRERADALSESCCQGSELEYSSRYPEPVFIQRSPSQPDELVRSATAVDVTADGRVDYQITGDINGNGVSDEEDRALLKQFANNVLNVNWLGRPSAPFRSINMYVSRFDTATKPVEVRLDFYQNEKPMNGKDTLMFSFTASDHVGKGNVELDEDEISFDAFDTSDRKALQRMINLYLKFNWQ